MDFVSIATIARRYYVFDKADAVEFERGSDPIGDYRRAMLDYAMWPLEWKDKHVAFTVSEFGSLEFFNESVVEIPGGYFEDIYLGYVEKVREAFKKRRWFEEKV